MYMMGSLHGGHAPLQPQDLLLQHSYIAPSVLVDDSLVADVLGPLRKLEGGQGLMSADKSRAHVGNDHRLGVATKGVLQSAR